MSESPVLAEGVAHPAAPKINAELYAVVQQAHKVLVWGELSAVADRASSMLTKAPDTPTVVVIGEVKRGKAHWSTPCWDGRMLRRSASTS